jgi:hypothetical protein
MLMVLYDPTRRVAGENDFTLQCSAHFGYPLSEKKRKPHDAHVLRAHPTRRGMPKLLQFLVYCLSMSAAAGVVFADRKVNARRRVTADAVALGCIAQDASNRGQGIWSPCIRACNLAL